MYHHMINVIYFLSGVVALIFPQQLASKSAIFVAEFTTMAGRRLRDAVRTVLLSQGNKELDSSTHVVIAGLTNAYSQYVTTFEEYRVQRYEVLLLSHYIIV